MEPENFSPSAAFAANGIPADAIQAQDDSALQAQDGTTLLIE